MNRIRKTINIIFFFIMLFYISTAFAIERESRVNHLIEDILRNSVYAAKQVEQVLLVMNSQPELPQAVLYFAERNKDKWEIARIIEANIGRKGFSYLNEKREGDGKTPSGIYSLEFAFGYANHVNTKMPYRQATENDYWIDDVKSESYNEWIRGTPRDAKSWEMMKRKDDLYKYGLVIGYNRNPIVKGLGSAIFLHVQKGKEEPTDGCIAVEEKEIIYILRKLDPNKKPVVIMGDKKTLSRLSHGDSHGFSQAEHGK